MLFKLPINFARWLFFLVCCLLFIFDTNVVLAKNRLHDVISSEQWQAYKKAFIKDGGRIVDTGNGDISHSEGQGYGMILSVAVDDKSAFKEIWQWTQKNLQRKDKLFGWKWYPDKDPHVPDWNNATDGDMLITWGLILASQKWNNPEWENEARIILTRIKKTLIIDTSFGPAILPGQQGFQNSGNTTLNLSYWIFPAFASYNQIDPDPLWAKLTQSGLKLLSLSKFGSYHLPPDWEVLYSDQKIGLPTLPSYQKFGFNVVRVPLYLCWAGISDPGVLASYSSVWPTDNSPAWLNLVNHNRAAYPLALSQRAIRQLVLHCLGKKNKPLEHIDPKDYYGSTLVLLTLLAIKG